MARKVGKKRVIGKGEGAAGPGLAELIGVAIPPPLTSAVLSATVEDANKNGRVDSGETDPNRYDPAAPAVAADR